MPDHTSNVSWDKKDVINGRMKKKMDWFIQNCTSLIEYFPTTYINKNNNGI